MPPLGLLISCVTAFRASASGGSIVPPRIIIPFDDLAGTTLFKPAYVPNHALGIKVVSVRPRNAAKQLATVPGVIMLFDIETAAPLCVMDGTYLTALRFGEGQGWINTDIDASSSSSRTAAGSAISTQFLSPEEASHLVVFGAGLQAMLHIEAIVYVRLIKRGKCSCSSEIPFSQGRLYSHDNQPECGSGAGASRAVCRAIPACSLQCLPAGLGSRRGGRGPIS